jgi:hypothetical protein
MIDFNDIDNYECVDEFEGFGVFKRFLEKYNLLDDLTTNFYNCKNSNWKKKYWGDKVDDEYTLNGFLNHNSFFQKHFIGYIFIWDETPEGYEFWRDINDKWEQYYFYI